MPNILRLPYTECFERVMLDFVRDATVTSTNESKYKGRVNDVYLYTIPAQIDYKHIIKTGYITTTADYSTGHVSVTLATTVTGASTSWTSANSNNMLLKVSGYDELYRCTYSASTTLTIDRSWIGDVITSNIDYSLFQDRYALSSDFDRMIENKDEAVYYWDGGNKVYLKYKDPDIFEDKQSCVPGTPGWYTIKYVNGGPYIYIDVPDTDSRTIHYKYMPSLVRMTEYTTGTITTLANGGVTVTGSGTDFDGYVSDTTNYDYYFRLDRDGTSSNSKWYKITTAGSDTSITLSDAYEGTAVSAASLAYTISKASLLPAGLDLAIVYGAAMASASDQQNKTQIAAWGALYTTILDPYKKKETDNSYNNQRLKSVYQKTGVRR